MLVTAPINKYSLELAGRGHDGHTEMLMEMSGAEWSLTVFLLERMKVAFYSRHLSLARRHRRHHRRGLCRQLERLARSRPRSG